MEYYCGQTVNSTNNLITKLISNSMEQADFMTNKCPTGG